MTDNKTSLNVLIALRKIMRAVDIHSKKMEKTYGLTSPQLILLKEINRMGEAPIGKLASEVNLSNATITGIVDRLEKKQLVARLRNGKDRRQVLVGVTESGREILKNAPSSLQEKLIGGFEKLTSDEQNAIVNSLDKLALLLGTDGLEVAPFLSSEPLPENGHGGN